MAINPATPRRKSRVTATSRYFSMWGRMAGPPKRMTAATKKNLPARPRIEAETRVGIGTAKTPEATVKTLYGIGVNAAVRMKRKAFF